MREHEVAQSQLREIAQQCIESAFEGRGAALGAEDYLTKPIDR